MKKLLFSLFVVATLFASCGSEDCELTELDEIIIGDWTLNGSDLTFNTDGSLDDPGNVIEASINDVDLLVKTWSLEGDSVLLVRASDDTGSGGLTTNFEIESYDCNEIKANAFITFTFKRK